ncbi:phospholipase D zeta 1-like isoform X2 [Phragmites australis]|uniref:phospholipase D zeta 1-like isoform X2 n=1 Tax=Phragmites australis TaxID=29695 RepID=UPI002D78D302|nr:phospholipase D zeta 1-like isoform X2 [Phragmites australis]
MTGERFGDDEQHGDRYVRMPPEPEEGPASSASFRLPESARVFDELPRARIVGVSRPDAGDITPMLLSYTIEVHYKQFRWLLHKKASEVLYLHFALKRRAFLEEFHEKQEQVKEWLQNLGIGEHMPVVHDDDEADDVHVPSQHDEHSIKNRNVPSSAVLPVIRPALGRQQSVSDRAKVAMQEYLNHFLGNLDIVNSREVCKFLEVSLLSFMLEYGPKLKEDYVTVRHLPKIEMDSKERCCSSSCFSFCNSNWQKVWAVLKPGFLALLQDPFDPKLLDIVIFDVSPYTDINGEGQITLAKEIKERNPLHFGFEVSSGGRTIKLQTRSSAKVKDWVTAINAARRPPEGWCCPHRFGSFAPPRGLSEDGSVVQWFIDGRAAFDAIASSIEEAKSEIFITDWWLCPELYLRRPFHYHGSSRLDILLESKAKQGVQIYILLYKEVSLALKINSMYSKRKLLNIHENVKVLRYPDHFSTGIYLWSHHEKIVVIDNQVCYIGGLDLCFGRYDSPEHKVEDFPASTWPGKDYYNPRESEPNSWEDTMKDELDRTKYPRMPWHDVQCALYGPACRDVARHFVQRWNYAKRNKAPNEQAIPLLMPHHHMVIPHYMGTSKETNGETESKQNYDKGTKVNRLNSLTTPASCQDIPLLLPHDPDHHALPNGDLGLNGMDINNGLSDHSNKTNWNQPLSNRKAKQDLSVQDLQMKGFVDNVGSPEVSLSTHYDTSKPNIRHIDKEWWETQERGDQVASVLDVGEVGPRATCRCQVVRSVGPWSAGTTQIEGSIHNAYFSLIEKAEHFVYIENQFFISGLSGDDTIKNRVLEALYRRILRAEKEKKCFRVIIVIPLLPGFQGGIDDGGAASVRAIMHWQYRTICRGPNSILKNLYDVVGMKAHDYISFYGLRAHGRLGDGGPLVTNQIYLHSKLMIIDDRMTLIGSANINDRSLLGSRDSEIGMIIEDKEVVSSTMDGRPWEAGKLSLSLRLSLWAEHLGLLPGEVNCIMDPVDDSAYKNIWMATAKENTMIYQQVFSCVPNDHIHSRAQFRQSFAHRKEKIGHTTIDLGVALEKPESQQNGDLAGTDPMERLQAVRGHIVSFPLEFMCQEDLRPFFSESEFYTSPQVFH